MQIKNEEQRKLLLLILESTIVNGVYGEARKAVSMLDELRTDISNAQIEKAK